MSDEPLRGPCGLPCVAVEAAKAQGYQFSLEKQRPQEMMVPGLLPLLRRRLTFGLAVVSPPKTAPGTQLRNCFDRRGVPGNRDIQGGMRRTPGNEYLPILPDVKAVR